MTHKFLRSCLLVIMVAGSLVKTAVADTATDLRVYMEHVRNEKVVDDAPVLKARPDDLLDAMEAYTKDSDERVRLQAVSLAIKIANQHQELKIKQAAVQFVAQVGEKDSDPSIGQWAVSRLLDFQRSDFNEVSVAIIRRLADRSEPWPESIKLVGLIGDITLKDKLQEFAQTAVDYNRAGWYSTRVWAAHLALARLGDSAEIAFCIAQVQAEKNDITRVTLLLNDLAYIRQPATIKVLTEYLDSDKRLPSVRDDGNGVPYSQYAADLLAKVIEGFPFKSTGPGYSSTQITQARLWIKAQKELEIKD